MMRHPPPKRHISEAAKRHIGGARDWRTAARGHHSKAMRESGLAVKAMGAAIRNRSKTALGAALENSKRKIGGAKKELKKEFGAREHARANIGAAKKIVHQDAENLGVPLRGRKFREGLY